MLQVIQWYERQKRRHQPVINKFKPELSLYVGKNLNEFKLNIPIFKDYLRSDFFFDKFANVTLQFRQDLIARTSHININDKKSNKEVTFSQLRDSAETFAGLLIETLEKIEQHEVSLPSVTTVEILYALANDDNKRIERQESLYKQVLTSLTQRNKEEKEQSNFLCECCDSFCELLEALFKAEFKEDDLAYPLLLALSLSHTSPRNVKKFLDAQIPNYKGDFREALSISLLEYEDLLFLNQSGQAKEWLTDYKPIVQVEENETVIEETQDAPEVQKPSLNFHSATVDEIFKDLKPFFDETEHAQLEELLKGNTMEGKLYFRGQNSTLLAFFRDLLNNQIIPNGQTMTANWLNFYFNADNQLNGKERQISTYTAINYFKSQRKPHHQIEIKDILLKKNQKNKA
jgi:hypothetical protein